MNQYIKIALICLACILFIVAYGTYRCRTTGFSDPLTGSLVSGELSRYLDGWGILHFLFFAILAYMFPNKRAIIFLIVLGVAWELVEFAAKDHPFYLAECRYTLTTNKGVGWWYGRWEDLVMNLLGIYAGYSLGVSSPTRE